MLASTPCPGTLRVTETDMSGEARMSVAVASRLGIGGLGQTALPESATILIRIL